jgi:hypothetical protein
MRYAMRTTDPDEAAVAYRAAATRCSIETHPGDGIKLAYELTRRGIAVSFDPLDKLPAFGWTRSKFQNCARFESTGTKISTSRPSPWPLPS